MSDSNVTSENVQPEVSKEQMDISTSTLTAATTEETNSTDQAVADPEMEQIRARMREMEEEAAILRQYHSEVENQMNVSNTPSADVTMEEKVEADARSIYVGNVDYGATAEELEAHFHGCGVVNRVTILCNKFTGLPKGFAYVEFVDKESMNNSLALDDTIFRGRQIKVMVKRTNKPGLSSTNRPPRGRSRPRMIIKYVYGAGRRPRGFQRRRSYHSNF